MEEEKINPTLPEGEVQTPTQPVVDDAGVQSLLSELEKAGVTSPSQLKGQLTNAREYGRVVNMLGEIKAENAELREALKSIKTIPKQQDPYYEEEQPQASYGNIQDLISGAVKKAITEEKRSQLEAQRMAMQTWQEIQGDSDYEIIKEIWEDKMKDPNFNYQINIGEVDPRKAYTDVKVNYYKNLAIKAGAAIKTLKGGSTVAPPHFEGSSTAALSLPVKPSEQKEKIKSYKDRVNTGGMLDGDEEIDALISVLRGG